jgi:hypothetical protein
MRRSSSVLRGWVPLAPVFGLALEILGVIVGLL